MPSTQPSTTPLGPMASLNLSLGISQSCAIDASNLYCWGRNAVGEVGDGTRDDRNAPTLIDIDSPIQVSTENHHTCAVDNSKDLWCWGLNDQAQLGVGDKNNRNTPTFVDLDANTEFVFTGRWHTCAIDDEGTLWCWGYNYFGQLGLGFYGHSEVKSSPVKVDALAKKTVTGAAGYGHTCIIDEDGDVWCWGRNKESQLGLGHTNSQNTPTRLTGLTKKAVAIECGYHNNCIIDEEGGLWCWGQNNRAQLGLGHQNNVSTPTRVSSLDTKVIGLGVEEYHACIVDEKHDVWCWGQSDYGGLGIGKNTGHKDVPTHVTSAPKSTSVSVGRFFTCVMDDEDQVWCWGYNNHGQLGYGENTIGYGPNTDRYTPTIPVPFPQ